jgi:long-chain acyl-CoA synthetase
VLAAYLVGLGIERGDRVAVFANTREEWVIADVAILMAGATTVPIYQTLVGEQAAYILDDSGAKVLVAEDATFVERVAQASRASVERLARIVVIDVAAGVPKGADAWTTVLERAPDAAAAAKVDERMKATVPDELATIVYTSGTTGPPKGVMLTHANFVFETESVTQVLSVGPDDEQLLFLPMAHIFAKILLAQQFRLGFVTSFAESILKALDNAAEVNPTFMGCVPRLYEKIFAVANEKAAQQGGLKASIFKWATGVGREASRVRSRGGKPSGWLGVRYDFATKLALSKIRARFGTRLRFAISGGAPLAKELAEWFHGAGVQVLEGYGLTETTAATNLNALDAYRFGTVGRTLPGVELKIAADGEILMRGPNIMKGYWKREADTRDVLDADGWFHSGDIGAIDEDGFLRITDRKKDIIVTAGGKNVAPQNIENLLKQSPWISQAMVYGDKKPFLVALVTLNPDAAARFASERGRANDLVKLADDGDVRALIQLEVDAVNTRLSSFETVKKFALVAKDFSIEGGELTPTLKVKRKVVSERYKTLLETLYQA